MGSPSLRLAIAGHAVPAEIHEFLREMAPLDARVFSLEHAAGRVDLFAELSPEAIEGGTDFWRRPRRLVGAHGGDEGTVPELRSLRVTTLIGHAVPLGLVADIIALSTAAGGTVEAVRLVGAPPVAAFQVLSSGRRWSGPRAAKLRSTCASLGATMIEQDFRPELPRLVAFDVDSTLLVEETIDVLGEAVGASREVARLTEIAMQGGMDFRASLHRRVALLAGLPIDVAVRAAESTTIRPGAAELVADLKRAGVMVAAFSGGFTLVENHLRASLPLDHFRANRLEVRQGLLTGRLLGPMMDAQSKAENLRQLAAEHAVAMSQTAAIGDGANDIPMVAVAGLGIAFNGKPALKRAADVAVDSERIDAIRPLLAHRH